MSDVVKLYTENSIGIVVLEERENKNTFSKDLIQGLIETFTSIKQNPDIKVVVIHGYENYFCCGGSIEGLISICNGTTQFTNTNSSDLDIYDLLIKCEVPVIAAMQGHAIGGGLVFGCSADIIVMGIECIYAANFMKYGFTPGMGATYIIKKKLGEVLGTEMLFSARNYYGDELKQRGASAKIVKKKEVINSAMRIAGELGKAPLLSLKLLKEHMTYQTRLELPEIISKELAMHKLTFAQPEIKERINELYNN